MPAATLSKEEIVDRLFTTFRDRGFEGASLGDLSRATGLGRSSLYHYFPGGKQEMAEAVLAHAQATIELEMLQVAQTAEPLRRRVERIAAAVERMYAGGQTPCVLGQMATAEIGPTARGSLKGSFTQWIAGIATVARESGMTEARAHDFAEDWVAWLQGALILRAAGGGTKAFARALTALRGLADAASGETR